MDKSKIILGLAVGLFIVSSCSILSQREEKMEYTRLTDQQLLPSNRPILLTNADFVLLKNREASLDKIYKKGNAALNLVPSPVENYAPSPHYTKDGPNEIQNTGKELSRDFRATYALALCYKLTGEKKYAEKAHKIMDAWSSTLKAVTTRQGRDNINFNAPYIMAAAMWTKDVQGWKAKAFGKMVKNIFIPSNEMTNNINHGLWSCYMVATTAAYLNDMPLMRKAYNRWTEILKNEVQQDGTMPLEMQRTNTTNWRGGAHKGIKGIDYTHFALSAASLAAVIFEQNGIKAWNSEGGLLIKKAFNKVAQWVNTPSTFPYYASNKGKLIGVYNAPYFPLLLRYYPNKDAEDVVKSGKIKTDLFYMLELFPTQE